MFLLFVIHHGKGLVWIGIGMGSMGYRAGKGIDPRKGGRLSDFNCCAANDGARCAVFFCITYTYLSTCLVVQGREMCGGLGMVCGKSAIIAVVIT